MIHEATLIRPTVFLDTNALHNMSTYLQNAKRYGLPPYTEKPMEYEQVKAELRKYLPRGITDSLMNGCKVVAYLESQTLDGDLNGVVVYASHFSKLEVIYGVLEGQAHAQMALAGIPYRMRQRQKDMSKLVSMYLGREDYERVVSELDEVLQEVVNKAGVRINFVEDENNYPIIVALAGLLQSNVFLDVIDCWMYGCALAVQADYILTFDEYFAKVVNYIHNPLGDSDWLQIQEAVRDELTRLFPVPTEVHISFPEVRKPPKQTPRPW